MLLRIALGIPLKVKQGDMEEKKGERIEVPNKKGIELDGKGQKGRSGRSIFWC